MSKQELYLEMTTAAAHHPDYMPWMKAKKQTKQEQRELIKRAQAGDIGARNEMVVNNMPFVRLTVLRLQHSGSFYCPRYLTFEDLVHAGAFGLIRAIEKFNLKRKEAFTTYARHWIRHFVRDHINFSKLRRLPNWVFDNKKKVPTSSEKTQRAVRHYRSTKLELESDLKGTHTSGESNIQTIDHHIDMSFWGNTITDRSEGLVTFSQVDDHDEMQALMRNLRFLERDEQLVILARLRGLTLKDIGEKLGKTREGIRVIELRATIKLRELMA